MPRRDGTGPMGTGARTGRGLGRCYNVNVNSNNIPTAKNSSNNALLEEKRILEEKLKDLNEKLKE